MLNGKQKHSKTQEIMSTQTQTKETLDILAQAFIVFDQAKPSRNRTFFIECRKFLNNAFSVRYIYNTHQMQYETYIDDHFTNPDSKLNAVELYGQENVMQLLTALDGIIDSDDNLKESLEQVIQYEQRSKNAPVVKSQVDEALAEIKNELAGHNVIEPEQAKTTEELTAPKPVHQEVPKTEVNPVAKPTHGLGFDMPAVMHNASVEFLLSEKAGIMKIVKDKIEQDFFKNTIVVLPNMTERKKQSIVKGRLHKSFPELMEVLTIENQAFLGGAAGTGKTTLAAQAAEALELPFAHISCTAGMSEAHLLGRMIADGTYISSKFVELYENGGVFLADEVDAADANTTLVLNSALANGYISVPNRAGQPTAKRHENFYMVCAANTFGNGSAEYAGREIMDAAFMDRFAVAKLHVDYDTELEKDICKDCPDMARAIHKLRSNVVKHKMRRIVSTRVFASAAKAKKAGIPDDRFFDRFFVGWTLEEIAKATAV